MGNWLRQSTAASIMLGPLVSNTDGFSPCAATFNATDVRLSKNGATFAAKNEATAPSSAEFGWFKIILNTTDTNTAGDLVIAASVTGAIPVWREYMVLAGSAYDAMINNTNGIRTNVVEWNSASIAAPDTAGYPKVTYKYGTGTGELEVYAGQVVVGTNNDKALYSLTTATHNQIAGSVATAACTWSYGTRALTDKVDFGLSASAIDEIWNESNTGHTTASTYGWFIDKQISEVSSGSSGGATAADIWSYSNRALSASSIAASTFATNAIDTNAFATTAGSKIWDAAVRTITGGSVQSASVSDKTGFYLAASAIAASTFSPSAITNGVLALTAASQIWNAAVRSITDKTSFVLAASSIAPSTIAASTITDGIFSETAASQVWRSAARIITGGSVVATSGSVVTTSNLDKTGYSVTTLGASAISETIITDAARTSITDNLLKRDLAGFTGEAARSVLNALRFLRNKWTVSGSDLIVYKEDDTTQAWTAALTSSSSASPITGTDPA